MKILITSTILDEEKRAQICFHEDFDRVRAYIEIYEAILSQFYNICDTEVYLHKTFVCNDCLDEDYEYIVNAMIEYEVIVQTDGACFMTNPKLLAVAESEETMDDDLGILQLEWDYFSSKCEVPSTNNL